MIQRILSVIAALTAATVLAQERPVQERVDVNVVLIDATVTDKEGNPILGLTADDFIVTENGIPQQIESVDYFTSRRAIDRPEAAGAFRVERVKEERYLIFFFQKNDPMGEQTAFGDLQLARQAAAEFVDKQMIATDRVAVVSHDVRLKVFTDFTGDRKTLKRAIDQAVSFASGLRHTTAERGSASILANVDRDAMMNKTGRMYEALEILADSVKPIRARKIVVLFSPGIGEPGFLNPSVVTPETREMERTTRALNGANVTVEAIFMKRDMAYSQFEEALSRLADETGGSYYRNLVRFETALKRINRRHAGYYLLTYTPSARKNGRGYQDVTVRLKNREFKVTARPGYEF